MARFFGGEGEAPRNRGLRAAVVVLALSAALSVPGRTQFLADPAPPSVLGESLGDTVHGTVQPAYRFLEGFSDEVYGFMRDHVIRNIMPNRMTRNLQAAPLQDSTPLFERNLSEKETRFLQRAREAYPGFDAPNGISDPLAIQAWRSWAAEEQASVAVDALRDTLLERYQLEILGRSAQNYARQQNNWDPGLAAMAGVVGGALLYFNGLHAVAQADGWRLAVDLRSGLRVQQALRSDSTTQRLAGLELSRQGLPVAVTADWGAKGGRLLNDRVGLVYRIRY